MLADAELRLNYSRWAGCRARVRAVRKPGLRLFHAAELRLRVQLALSTDGKHGTFCCVNQFGGDERYPERFLHSDRLTGLVVLVAVCLNLVLVTRVYACVGMIRSS